MWTVITERGVLRVRFAGSEGVLRRMLKESGYAVLGVEWGGKRGEDE